MVGPVSWDSLSGMDSPGGSGVCSQPGSYEAALDLVCLARVPSRFLPLAFYPLWLPFSSPTPRLALQGLSMPCSP